MSSQTRRGELADARHLPTPPVAAMELLRLSRDPDAGVSDMASVLSLDAGLAAKIIGTANSPIYRREVEATTIERAISQIGVRSVVTVALAHSVTAQLPANGKISGLDLNEYWQRSMVTAVVCRDLCGDRGDEAFLVGLMANIGKVAMARSLGQLYADLVEISGGWPSMEDETGVFGVNSLQMTSEVLIKWSLPEVLADAVAACSVGVSRGDDALGAALAVALDVAQFGANGGRPEDLQTVLDTGGAAGFEGDQLGQLFESLTEHIAEAAGALSMPIDSADYSTLLDDARMRLVDMSIEADAQRVLEESRVAELEQTNRDLEERALTDGLTGLANRAAFDQALDQHIRLRLREPAMYTKPLGVVMIDIDHFKSVNDTHGHAIGDAVLKQLGLVMQMMSRTEEVAARYGGEEFVLIAPVADPDDLQVACERIRKAIELIEVDTPTGSLNVTASLGGACLLDVREIADGQRVLEAADQQLYRAKDGGRNQTRILSEVL